MRTLAILKVGNEFTFLKKCSVVAKQNTSAGQIELESSGRGLPAAQHLSPSLPPSDFSLLPFSPALFPQPLNH